MHRNENEMFFGKRPRSAGRGIAGNITQCKQFSLFSTPSYPCPLPVSDRLITHYGAESLPGVCVGAKLSGGCRSVGYRCARRSVYAASWCDFFATSFSVRGRAKSASGQSFLVVPVGRAVCYQRSERGTLQRCNAAPYRTRPY